MTDDTDVVAALERPLPRSLHVGRATALFVLGTCFHPTSRLDDLRILIDGVSHGPAAFGMWRPDMRTGGEHAGRSGFWATVPVEARDRPDELALELEVRPAGGSAVTLRLATIEIVERPRPVMATARPERPGPPLIAVCMATFAPDLRLLRTQIESLRRQTDDAWICLVSDDCSAPDQFEEIQRMVSDDPRFQLSRSPIRQGFYRNFERALEMVPDDAALVALCDQDDCWHDDKLETLRAALGETVLVYSDQRLVDAGGRVLRNTLWKGRSNNHTNLASMMVANTVTGAAALFRRDLLELLLPFPDTPGFQFHDHWLGVAALAAGDVAYVDRPLYDYVQHTGAVFGDVTSGKGKTARRYAPSRGSCGVRALALRWRAAYFYGYLAREVQAQVLLARAGPSLADDKKRVLQRFIGAARSPAALAWLVARSVRILVGHTETLGSETQLAKGILWRWMAGLLGRSPNAWRSVVGDSAFPPPDSFNQPRLRRWRASV